MLNQSLRTLRLSIIVTAFSLAISGCAWTQTKKDSSVVTKIITATRVLVMDPDIELSLLLASGLEEPNAQLTVQGLANVRRALANEFNERNLTLVPYAPPQDDRKLIHDHNQLLKLHEAVGLTILRHEYIAAQKLPTKQQRFDWNLGPYARDLRNQYDADYALFINMRDSYASSGRVATIMVMAVLGVGKKPGVQIGFASIVDLRNGDIIWFNRLIDITGDLRDSDGSRKAVKSLLTGAPF